MGLAHRDNETVIETSPQLIESLHAAREFAAQAELLEVAPHHLLLAMLADDEASFLLEAYAVEFDKIRAAIHKLVDKLPRKYDADEITVFSRAIEIVLEHARHEARKNGLAEVDSNLVLAVLLSDEKGDAARLMQPYDLDTSGVLQYLELREGKVIQIDPLPPLPAPREGRPREAKAAPAPAAPSVNQPADAVARRTAPRPPVTPPEAPRDGPGQGIASMMARREAAPPPAAAAALPAVQTPTDEYRTVSQQIPAPSAARRSPERPPMPAPPPAGERAPAPPRDSAARASQPLPLPSHRLPPGTTTADALRPAAPHSAPPPAQRPPAPQPIRQPVGQAAAAPQGAPRSATPLVDQIVSRAIVADARHQGEELDAATGQSANRAARRRRPSAQGLGANGTPSATGSVLERGRLVESVPRRMRVDRPVDAEVRITRAQMNEISDEFSNLSASHVHELVMTEAMTVQLRAPGGGFHIENLSPQTQWIDRNQRHVDDADFGAWRWTVTPRKAGRARLQLVISARTVDDEGRIHIADVPDKLIDISVGGNRWRSLARAAVILLACVGGALVGRYAEEVLHLLASLPRLLH